MLSPRMRQFLDRLPGVLAAKPGPACVGAAIVRPTSWPGCSKRRCTTASRRMRYHSVSSGRVKDYVVHPYRLAFAQGELYLLAYVPEYDDVRTFAVDRIAVGVAREADLHARAGAVGDDVFANSLGVNTGPAGAGRNRVRRPGRAVRPRPRLAPVAAGPAKARPATLSLSMDVCHDWALRSWILSWGPLAPRRSPRRRWRRRSGTTSTQPSAHRYSTRSMRSRTCRRDARSIGLVRVPRLLVLAGPHSSSASTPTGSGSARSATSRCSRPCCAAQSTLFIVGFVGGLDLARAQLPAGARPRSATRARRSSPAKGSRCRCRAAAAADCCATAVATWSRPLRPLRRRPVGDRGWPGATRSPSASRSVLGYDVGFYVFSLPFCQFAPGHRPGAGRAAGAASPAALYFVTGSLTSASPPRGRCALRVRRHLALLGGRVPPAAGVRRLAAAAPSTCSSRRRSSSAPATPTSMAACPRRWLLAVACVIGAGLAVLQALSHAQLADAGRRRPLPRSCRRRRGLRRAAAALRRDAERAGARDAVHPAQHRRDAPGLRPRPRRGARAVGRRAADARPTSSATRRRSRTCGCGITSRCSRRSDRSRRSAPTTTSSRSTTTATGSTAQLRQVMLSARELNSASLPNRTWVNERLTFTHGYGLTLGPVNQVTSEGLPVLFVRDLPPVTDAGLEDRPSPASTSASCPTTTSSSAPSTQEFHYPRGDDNVFTRYDGTRRRAARFALAQAAVRPALRRLPDRAQRRHRRPRAGILFNRNIGERVRADRAVPDLRPGSRTWCSPTAGCTGSTTPTRPAPLSLLHRAQPA